MIHELKELNFNKILILDTDISKYDFDEYLKNGRHSIKGFCTKCENEGINISPYNDNFKLQTISHATMSDDIIMSSNEKIDDLKYWKDDGILFVMESPSNRYDSYIPMEYDGYKKYPTASWYLFQGKHEKYSYPEYFAGKQYWNLFNSIVFTFKLKKAYLTNFTKCGLNDENDNFIRFYSCSPDCIKKCFYEYLRKELDILKPKVVFCFGSTTLEYFEFYSKEIYSENFPFKIILLPHPGNRMKYEYLECIYFNKILEGLYQSNIYSKEETIEKYTYYLELNINRRNGT